jgi:hypothetical protein
VPRAALGFAEPLFAAVTVALVAALSFTLGALRRTGAFAVARFAGAAPLLAERFGSAFLPERVAATDFFAELDLREGLGFADVLGLLDELGLLGVREGLGLLDALGLRDGRDFFARP